MKIYLLCRNVDLGYYVILAFYNREEAKLELDRLTKEHYNEGRNYDPALFIEESEIK